MKFSKSFIQTLREVPNDVDADNVSQVLMARAGLVKRMSNGLYVRMPLANKAIQNIEAAIRQGMASVDCAEVNFPNIVQKTDLIESGRWNAFGDEIFKLLDRNKKEVALAPTAEEAACFMARQYVQSHNQLPLSLFQMQKKYRDEISPRGGVLRTREFTMKDAYSFDTTRESLDMTFKRFQDAYCRIFDSLGLKYVHVGADVGAMGGYNSREFMVFSNSGSDTVAVCDCGFAANIEISGDKKTCDCGKNFTFHKAFEIGHIFALGTYYTEKLNITYTAQNGKNELVWMGCYGIGVDRILAALIEQNHDDKGIVWQEAVAPITHNIITLAMDDAVCVAQSKALYEDYLSKGVAVMWDERTNVSAGVKLKDSDLLGIPNKIVIGKKGVSHEKR